MKKFLICAYRRNSKLAIKNRRENLFLQFYLTGSFVEKLHGISGNGLTWWQYWRASGQYFSTATNWKQCSLNLLATVEYGSRGSERSHSMLPLDSSELIAE